MFGQPTTQPTFAATDIQHTFGLQCQHSLDDRSIGDQAATFDALFTHCGSPGIGIGLPALLELFSMVALHADTLRLWVAASLAGQPIIQVQPRQ